MDDGKNVIGVSKGPSVAVFKVRRWTLLEVLDLKLETLLSFETIRYCAKFRKTEDWCVKLSFRKQSFQNLHVQQDIFVGFGLRLFYLFYNLKVDLTFMGPCIANVFLNITNRM